jgi:prepilin-type N-terminal cleavage/methylation domain-containing protein
MKRFNKKQSGFTLLELLVVVSILAIIAGAVISSLDGKSETAGQGVALHTMGTLENATRQHQAIERGLPNSLDSLLCAPLGGGTPVADTDAVDATATVLGGTSNATGVGGGLTLSYATKLGGAPTILPAEGVAALTGAGMSSIRYVEVTYCDDDETNGVEINGVVAADLEDAELVEANANLLFLDPNVSEETGRGMALDLVGNAAVLAYADPDDIGATDDDLITVFGVGNGSSYISNNYIARAPRDGNAPATHYSNFALAVKVATDTGTAADATAGADGTFDPGEYFAVAEFVAILDSDGDYYEDEVAEFNGLEEE